MANVGRKEGPWKALEMRYQDIIRNPRFQELKRKVKKLRNKKNPECIDYLNVAMAEFNVPATMVLSKGEPWHLKFSPVTVPPCSITRKEKQRAVNTNEPTIELKVTFSLTTPSGKIAEEIRQHFKEINSERKRLNKEKGLDLPTVKLGGAARADRAYDIEEHAIYDDCIKRKAKAKNKKIPFKKMAIEYLIKRGRDNTKLNRYSEARRLRRIFKKRSEAIKH